MSNFTRSGGRAKKWQSITNLSCCSIEQLTKPFISMKALAFIMLFAFSSSTMFASEFISGCQSEAPDGPTAEMYALSVECEGTVQVVKTTEMLGDDCSWEVIHSYQIKCNGQDLPTAKIHFIGGDDMAPTLEGELPPNQSNLNLCFDEIPAGPSIEEIAALYEDNCSDVFVTKSGSPNGTDCDWTVKYLYTIRDACFNYATEVEIDYSGGDTEAPKLRKNQVIPPGAQGLNLCFDNKSQGPSEEEIAALFEDNCGNVYVSKSESSKGYDCKWIAIYTYTIQDDCENFTDDVVITYSGGDSQAPEIFGAPGDTTVNCKDEIGREGQLEADDNCADELEIIFSEDLSNLGPDCEGGFVVRTWTTTDDCGHSDTKTQTITVLPAPPAQWEETPGDKEITCSEADGYQPELLYYNNGVDGGDCAIYGEAIGVLTGSFDECGGNLKVTWTFEDECGREISHVQDIVVLPAPAAQFINPPQDMQISCEQANQYQVISIAYSNGLDGDCGINGEVPGELSGSYDECGGTLFVDWFFQDDCDRQITYRKIITVEPAPAAEFDPVEGDTISCEDANNYAAGSLGYSNNGTGLCLIEGSVPGELSGSYDECGGTLYVDWYFKDECEREITKQITIIVEPAPAAEFDPVEGDTISCEDANNYAAGSLGYSNNGTGLCLIEGSVEGELSGEYDECGGTLYVDWYFKDECEREITKRIVIIVEPAPAAEFDPVEGDTISCEDANNYAAGSLGYSNNGTGLCLIEGSVPGELSGSYDECGGTLYVDWYFKDDCEREITKQITIIVEPAPAAEFDPVENDVISCEDANNYAAGSLGYSNNGTGLCLIEGSVEGELSGEYDECGGLLFVDWYFKDDCDREITRQIQIKVEPAPAAEFDPVEGDTISCEEANNYAPASLGYSNNGTGLCLIEGSVPGELSGSYDECGGTLYVDWYFQDACEREITKQITIIVEPAPAAQFDPVEGDTISCEDANNYAPASLGYSNNGTGLCLIEGSVPGELSGSYDECGGTLYVDWYFKDECEREITKQITIIVEPAPAAEFDPVEGDTISCEDANNYAAGSLGYSNNGTGLCLIEGSVPGELSGEYDECGGTLYVDWYFKDECEREITKRIVIIVEPAPAAEFDPVEGDTISCEDANNYAAGSLGYSNNGTGLCLIEGSVEGELSGEYDECGGTLYVDWYFKDDCEREISKRIVIIVEPAPAAEFDPVEGDTISCEDANNYAPASLGYSNNGTGLCLIEGSVPGELSGSYDECGGTLYVDWYFIDDCEREITKQITIIVEPAPAAQFEPVEGDTISCEDANNYAPASLGYSNNGTGLCLIEGSVPGELSGSYDECGGTLYVDWYFKDECEREITKQITIIVEPAPKAEFDPVEGDTISCEEAMSFQPGYLAYTNNGTGLCLIAGEVLGELSGSFDECGGTLYVDWFFKDECDRESTAQQVIIVEPAPPAVFDPIEDANIFCEDLAAYQPEFLGYSNGHQGACEISGSVQGVADPFDGSCGQFEVNFTFTDDCGRTITEKQIITVIDETAPVLEGVIPEGESNMNLCYDQRPDENSHPFLADAYIASLYTDNCGNVNVTHTVVELGDDCDWAIMFRYEIQDDCDNFADPVKIFFNGGDTSAPELTGDLPEGVSGLQCLSENPGAPDEGAIAAAYTDNCGNINVTPLEPVISGDDCGWTATYEYIIEDDCGNKADNVIIVNSGADTTPPTLDGEVPMGANTLDLCIDSPLGEPSEEEIAALYSDNCLGPITVIKVEKVYGTDCEWIRVFEYQAEDSCGNKADLVKVNYQGGDASAPEPTGLCSDETVVIRTEDWDVDCPADAYISLIVGDEISIADKDWTIGGVSMEELGGDLSGCFTDNCADVADLTFRVTDKDGTVGTCSTILTLTFEVEDNCENIYEGFVCTFVIVDNTAPVVTCPADIDFGLNPELGDDGKPVGTATKADYTDNCQPDGETEDYVDSEIQEAIGDNFGGTFTIFCYNNGALWSTWNFVLREYDSNGYPIYDGLLPEFPTETAVMSYNFDLGRYEVDEFNNGGIIYDNIWHSTTDSTLPLCDPNAWVVDNQYCTLEFDCGSLEGSSTSIFSFVRTFTADDGCGNTATCDVTYTWSTEYVSPCDNYPVVECGDVAVGNTSDGGEEDVVGPFGATGNWYRFIGTGQNLVVLSTCNDADYDTLIILYEGCGETADPNSYLAFNDDAGGCGLTSELGFFAEEGVEYSIFIRGYNGAVGNYGLSVLCDTVVGAAREAIVNEDVKIDFTAYPVPFNNEVNIAYTFEFETNVTIQLFDTKGLLILSQTNESYVKGSKDKTTFDLSRTANQMFYVQLTTSQGTVTKKIVSSSKNRR